MKVNAQELDEAVLAVIQKQAEVVLMSADLSGLKQKGQDAHYIADCEKQIRECVEQRQRYYEQFVLREIDRETHKKLKAECAAQIDRFNNHLAILRQSERDKQAAQKATAVAKRVLDKAATPKEIVDTVVGKVLVFPGNNIEIQWKISDFAYNERLEK